jgi:hypothetical protein
MPIIPAMGEEVQVGASRSRPSKKPETLSDKQ